MSERKEISISGQLHREIEVAYKNSNHDVELDSYIEELIRKGLASHGEKVYEQPDEDKIKERLQALGYID